jgi:hypothetical protein
LRAAAPELAGVNVYLVDSAKLSGDARPSRQVYAFTHVDLDLVVEPFVQWAGRGIAVVYSGAAIVEDTFDEESLRLRFLALMVHEVAHALALEFPTAIAAELVTRERNPDDGYQAIYLRHHDERFIRAVCHLKWRIEATAGELLALTLIEHKDFGRQLCFFARALGDEMRLFAEWPIEKVLALPLPPAFAELWREDVLDFQRKYSPSPKGESRMSVATIITRIKNGLIMRRDQGRATFAAIARTIADGNEPNADDVARALELAGKTAEDLEKEVARILRRRQLRATLDAAQVVPAERIAVNRAAEKANAILALAEKRHEETIFPLGNRLRELDRLERDATAAMGELIQTADESIRARRQELGRELGNASSQRTQIDDALRTARTELASAEQFLFSHRNLVAKVEELGPLAASAHSSVVLGGVSIEQVLEAQRTVPVKKAEIDKLTEALAAADRHVAEAQHQVEELEAQLLVP